MEKTITAREANQKFARVLREVEEGRAFVVTKRGLPIARIAPVVHGGKRVLTAEQQRVREKMIKRLRRGWKLGIGKFDRDSLYDDRLNRLK